MVPDTAPTANSTPMALAQVCASATRSASSRRRPRHSAYRTIDGKPTPKQAITMCQPSETAICIRAW
jgi:hypothetical protein